MRTNNTKVDNILKRNTAAIISFECIFICIHTRITL